MKDEEGKVVCIRPSPVSTGFTVQHFPDGDDQAVETTLSNKDFQSLIPQFEVYYKAHRFTINGYWQYVWHVISLKSLRDYVFDRSAQTVYSLRRPSRRDRLELMQFMINDRLKNETDKWSASSFSSEGYKSHIIWARELHGDRLFGHPAKYIELSRTSLSLQALVESGEVEKLEGGYRASPKALNSIAEYEVEEQRHKDQVKWSRRLAWLTGALIFVGIGQPLLDWWLNKQ